MTISSDVVVAVPVRNEVERLPRLLDALVRQTVAGAFTVCLFFDNCDDGSQAMLAERASALPYPVITASRNDRGPPNAGAARRRAVALALRHMPNGVLLSTDADSEPAADWVVTNLAALACADIVAGRIRRGAANTPVQDRLERYLDRLHALRRMLDPVPWEDEATHHWVSAASLAMTMRTYRALGGFDTLANGEDAALGDAAARAGLRLRRDQRVTVRTSSRRKGRATAGFAATLAALDDGTVEPTVVHPEDEMWRFAAQAEARSRHGSGDLRPLAARLRLSLAEVEQVARECPNGEAFAARIVGPSPGGLRPVSLARAEAVLATIDAPLEGAA